MPLDRPNRLAAVLTNHIPDGYQLEVHEDDGLTTFRYKRIADGVWCQEAMANVVVDYAINSVESIADGVLRSVAQKFAEYDGLDRDKEC